MKIREHRINIKRLYLKFLRYFTKILIGNTSAQMPLNAVRSIVEAVANNVIRKHLAEIMLFRNSVIEHYNFPEHYPSSFRRQKAFDERYIYKMRNVVVSPHSGICWIKEGRIFVESIGSVQRIMGWGGNLAEIVKSKRLNDSSEFVCFPDTGYFHWLLEVLPIFIHALKKNPQIKVITSKNINGYQKDVLSILFKNNIELKIVQSNLPLEIENYILLSIEPYSGFVTQPEIMELRSTFLPLINNNKDKVKIYISRSKTKKRKLKNENELEEKLKNLGFTIINSENIPFLRQVEIINCADVIIAPHGAGLANIVFAKEGTKVLEIFPYQFFNDCYARLAANVNINYEYADCSFDDSSAGIIPINDILAKIN